LCYYISDGVTTEQKGGEMVKTFTLRRSSPEEKWKVEKVQKGELYIIGPDEEFPDDVSPGDIVWRQYPDHNERFLVTRNRNKEEK
jgi:hypothetical protein